tara:strand:- start:14109 stop:14672 length:564 start_codon:yes stop_codon:yes gene_type:complete
MGLAILNTRSQVRQQISILVKNFIDTVYMGKVFPCHTSKYGIELIHCVDYHTAKESHFCEAYMNHPLVERTIKTAPLWTDGRRFKFPRVYLAANMTKNGDRVMPALVYLAGSEWYNLGIPAEFDDIMEPMWRSFAEDDGVFTVPHPELLFAEKPDASGRTLYEHWQAYEDFLAGFDPGSFKAIKLIK